MNEAEFTKKLLEMKREVLALKTAHQRGLGEVKTYQKSGSVQMTGSIGYYVITAILSYGEPPFPISEIVLGSDTWNSAIPVAEGYSAGGSSFSTTFLVSATPGQALSFSARSTAMIQELAIERRSV